MEETGVPGGNHRPTARGPSSLKFLPGMGLGGGVKFLIYFLEGEGVPGNLETPLATPLRGNPVRMAL